MTETDDYKCPMCPFSIITPHPCSIRDCFDNVYDIMSARIRHENDHVEDFRIELELMNI